MKINNYKKAFFYTLLVFTIFSFSKVVLAEEIVWPDFKVSIDCNYDGIDRCSTDDTSESIYFKMLITNTGGNSMFANNYDIAKTYIQPDWTLPVVIDFSFGPSNTNLVTNSWRFSSVKSLSLKSGSTTSVDSKYSLLNRQTVNTPVNTTIDTHDYDTASFRVCVNDRYSPNRGPDEQLVEEKNKDDNCSQWKSVKILHKPSTYLAADPISGNPGMSTTLYWHVNNDFSPVCTAWGDWSGDKKLEKQDYLYPNQVGGSETVGPLNEVRGYRFSMTCKNKDGETSYYDDVYVCSTGQTWNGSSCVSKCSANQTWNGYECITNSTPSGSISVSSSTCTIKDGDSTCPVSLTWTTKDLVAGKATAVTKNNPDNTVVSSQTSGNNVTNNVNYGSTRFFLYHNGSELASTGVVAASCGSNSSWDAATSKCKSNTIVDPNAPSGTLSVSPTCNIAADKNSCIVYLDWTTKNLIAGKETAVTTNRPAINTIVSKLTSNTKFAYTIYKGQSDFYLYHNSNPLVGPVIAEAVCVSGTSWDGAKCTKTGEIVITNNADLKMDVTYKDVSIKQADHTTTKIPYNSIVKVSWSSPLSKSCVLSSNFADDLKTSIDTKSDPYKSSGLKKYTTYTVNCREGDGSTKTDYVKVLVSPISTGYVEQ